jgi:hypothetical protein
LSAASTTYGAFARPVVDCALIAQANAEPKTLRPCFILPAIVQSSVRAIQSKILDRDTKLAKDDALYASCNLDNMRQDYF